jgi:large conductance mechanosensitive channel
MHEMQDLESSTRDIAGKIKNGVVGGGKKSLSVVAGVFSDFKEFINKGSVIDLAVGLVIGAAFTSIVSSFVKDLVSPFIALASNGKTLANNFILLRCPRDNGTLAIIACKQSDYSTVLIAESAGAITFNYGVFVQVTMNFLVTALIVFFIVKVYAAAFLRKSITEKECEFCLSQIPVKAIKCKFCTSEVSVDDKFNEGIASGSERLAKQVYERSMGIFK